MLAALRRPELVTHLVLSVTSGGMRIEAFDAQDWRPAVRAAQPGLPDWFTSYEEDLTPRLAAVLPQAELHVIPGGDHNVACTCASLVAPLIDRHLS